MKKAIILMAIMAVIVAGATFGQLRLGITAQDTYNGVMISAVHYGYPASGILRSGDIVRYAKVIYNSQPVMMSGNLMVMGMDQKVIVRFPESSSSLLSPGGVCWCSRSFPIVDFSLAANGENRTDSAGTGCRRRL